MSLSHFNDILIMSLSHFNDEFDVVKVILPKIIFVAVLLRLN
jgi:hypothetical protein